MLSKETKYSHNYATPIYPHSDLPIPKLKGIKRVKEESPNEDPNEEPKENNDEHQLFVKKRTRKRKLKKTDSELIDPLKEDEESSSPEINNSCENDDINPIMKCDISEESNKEEINNSEKSQNKENDFFEFLNQHNNDNNNQNNFENNKVINDENIIDQEDNASLHSGFPDLCVESDEESNSRFKSKNENMLSFFNNNGFIQSP